MKNLIRHFQRRLKTNVVTSANHQTNYIVTIRDVVLHPTHISTYLAKGILTSPHVLKLNYYISLFLSVETKQVNSPSVSHAHKLPTSEAVTFYRTELQIIAKWTKVETGRLREPLLVPLQVICFAKPLIVRR